MGGLMVVTAFLSMWINNSSATSIMLPVALAISDILEHHEKGYPDKKRAMADATVAGNGKITSEEKSKIKIYKLYYLQKYLIQLKRKYQMDIQENRLCSIHFI
jgi:sodium-dependent dicarboxylate transporter 2/3/5